MPTPTRNIVFLPGWNFHASALSIMEEHLHGYHFLYVNLPQDNNSETLETYIQMLPASSILIGWSLGGLTAIRLCAKYPSRFSQLILLGSSPKFVAETNWQGIDPSLAHQFKDHAERHADRCAEHFLRLTCYPSTSRKTREYLSTHRNAEQSLESKSFQLNDLLEADLRDIYAALKQPILNIAGEHDAVLPNSKINHAVIPRAGHAFFYTHTEETCRAIVNFMESHHAG